jgi:hypothetical protein
MCVMVFSFLYSVSCSNVYFVDGISVTYNVLRILSRDRMTIDGVWIDKDLLDSLTHNS